MKPTDSPEKNDSQHNITNTEIARREAVARAAFKDPNLSKKEHHQGLAYYIEHCFYEIEDEADFWINLIGKAKPEPNDIIEQLVLQSVWSSDDEETKQDKFDFWIKDYTDYVVCVTFNDDGEIISIDMES